jgi:hypothetical protein
MPQAVTVFIRAALAAALVVACVATWPAGLVAQAANPLLHVDAPSEAGDRFDVHIVVNNVENLGGYEFKLTFDPQLIAYASALKGELFVSGKREVICTFTADTPGEVQAFCLSLGVPSIDGVSGTGDLAVIKLTSIDAGESELGLKDVKFVTPYAQVMDVDIQAAAIRVDAGSSLPRWVWIAVVAGGTAVVAAAGFGARSLRRRPSA